MTRTTRIRPKFLSLLFGFSALISLLNCPAEGGIITSLNALTMGESTTSTIGILGLSKPTAGGQVLNFSGQLSDSEWSNHITGILNGDVLDVTIAGTVSGSVGEDIFISFSGAGFWGADPITISNGQSHYMYSSVGADYFAFDFQQLTKIGGASLYGGSASLYGWSVGLEWAGGAILGAIGGAAAGPAGGVIGAIEGGEAAASLSERIWELYDAPTTKPSTAGLTRPSPSPGETISGRGGNYELTAFDLGNGLLHSASGAVITSAEVNPDGTYSGTVGIVPEIDPAGCSSVVAFALGFLGYLERKGRRRGTPATV